MSGYQCMSEGCTNPVSWLVTHMNPAGTFSLCADDFPVMVINILAEELGADPERLYDAIKRHVDREAARAAKAVDKRTEERRAAGLPGDGSELAADGPYTGPDQQEQAAIDAAAALDKGTGP